MDLLTTTSTQDECLDAAALAFQAARLRRDRNQTN
jgi:hypothetical protein